MAQKQPLGVMEFIALQEQALAQRQMPASRRALGWLVGMLWAALKVHLLPRVPRSAWVILGGALALLVLAVDLHQSVPSRWPLGSLLMLGAPVVWWRGRSLARTMRVAASLVPIALGVWLALVWRSGPRPMLVLLLVSCALLAAGVYAWMRRGQGTPDETPPTAANPDEVIARWETITASKQLAILATCKPRVVERDDVGWTMCLDLPSGLIVEDVVPLAPRLASAIGGVARGAVSVTPVHSHAERCMVRVRVRDPLATVASWNEPRADSVLEPILIGRFEDGAPARLPLLLKPGLGLSVLVAGTNGQGKSGILNEIVAQLAHCNDVVLWGIDPQGTELGPWEPVLDRLVTDAGQEAGELIDAALRVIQARGGVMRERGIRAWVPTPKEPEIVIVADEAADLADHMPRLFELVRKGRKFGVHLVLATQRPSARALGDMGTEMRSQFRAIVCLGVEREDEVRVILGPSRSAEGWRADLLCKDPGCFLVMSPDPQHNRPRRARSYLIEDEQVQRWAARCAPLRPRLDDVSQRAGEGR